MSSRCWRFGLALLLGATSTAWSGVGAATPASAASAPARVGVSRTNAEQHKSEEGTRWSELSTAHKAVLKPLERDWAGLTATGKRKWIDIASRMPRMSPEERNRIETRMAQWAATTPAQRAQTRQQFKEAEQVAPKGRSAQWEAYQALSEEQKHQLARRALRANAGAAASGSAAASGTGNSARGTERLPHAPVEAAQQKSNIVPNPALAARPKAVSPVVVQAAPGATTTLLSKRAAPPPHQQAGLPKINGSPAFVNPATLLPRRGPQGAAVTAASASAALPRP